MFQFYIVLGDWSDDGHGKSEKILVETNIPMKDLQKAYKQSVKKTSIGFDCNEKAKIKICDEYEDNRLRDDAYEALKALNCPFNQLGFEEMEAITDDNFEDCRFDRKSLVNLLMWFIGLSTPGLEWKRVEKEDETPCFNGYWSKDLNIGIGYGLYE